MRILIVVPSQDRVSGNWVTAQRFQVGLEKHGHHVTMYDTRLHADETFRQHLLDFDPDVAILLHAYRSGKPWLETANNLNIPFVVLLTGTDVNHGLDDPEQSEVIHTILHQAASVLLHNPLIVTELTTNHPGLAANLRGLPPGITLTTSPYDLRDVHALNKQQTLFLCPAGLRPIKGNLELLKMFDQVGRESSAFHLAFCGPVLDEGYAKHFLVEVEKRSWASYLGVIAPEYMANAMRGADIVLNNSQAEGLANALLEAATIGIPILARNIHGNAAVVTHGSNGLLYNDEIDFYRYALQMLNREKRHQLICPAPNRYNPERETAELLAILHEAIG